MGVTTQTYDILSRIAVGNGALVYRAVEKSSLRQVALKLLVQEGEVDHRFDVDALLADSPRLKQITGSHVCQLLDAYKDEDGPVLAYEFVNGVSGTELPLQRKLEPAQAVDVAAQLISALRSGERQKTPHGDVKPSNLIFMELADKRPFTLVLDWGLTAYRTATADDTMSFLAPERLDGSPATHRADLFSAGATLFYLCTGKMLVTGTVRAELKAAWPQARPAILAELRPDLPAKFVQWIGTLLDPDPAKRPESAVEAMAALAALNPPPPAVPPETFRPRPTPPKPPGPLGSGIAKPPPAASSPQKPASGIRQQPPAPAAAPAVAASAATSPAKAAPQTPAKAGAPGTPVAKPGAAAPPHKAGAAMTIAFLVSSLALIAGIVWFLFFRDREVKYPGDVAKADPLAGPAPTVAARTPPPSVGQNIGKTYTPPPLPKNTTASTGTANQPAKPAKKQTPKPSPKPKPAAPANTAPSPFIAGDAFAGVGAGPVNGKNGGAGWAGPWKAQFGQIDPGPSPQQGSILLIPPTEQDTLLSRPVGSLDKFVEPADGGTWYFACRLQHSTDIPSPGGDIQINPLNAADIHDLVRIVATDTGGSLQLTLNNEKNPIEVKDNSKPVLVVLRITLTNPRLGNWDLEADLAVNPAIGNQWPPPGAQRVTAKLPNRQLPQQLGLLIRKPRAEATTRIADIRFVKKLTDLALPAVPAAK